jgi:hypothetical protein
MKGRRRAAHVLRTGFAAAVLPLLAACWGPPPRDPDLGPKGPPMERVPRVDLRAKFDADFRTADKDGNGTLSRAELEAWMPDAAREFNRIDVNRDGQVTREELQQYLQGRVSN